MKVKLVVILKDDISALIQLVESNEYSKRNIRINANICVVRYGFIDTSGSDLGPSIELDGVNYFWNKSVRKVRKW